jgi:protein phosphatase
MVMLIGASGAGKSSFARRYFSKYEVVSSDVCRAMISDDEGDQSVTAEAFDLLRYIARLRLSVGKSVVIDATNVKAFSRRRTIDVALSSHVPAFAIILDMPLAVCVSQSRLRERMVEESAIASQIEDLHSSLPSIASEGFSGIVVLQTAQEVEEFAIVRCSQQPAPLERTPQQ